MRTATIKGQTFTRQNSYTGPLVLVNPQHPLLQNIPLTEALAPVWPEYPDVKMLAGAGKMMRVLANFSGAEGQIVPVSGYRTHKEQVNIFETTLQEKGEEFTRQYVALPGCSEHQTGLALDVAALSDNIDFVCPNLPNSGVYAAFRNLAADYGFIQRYPAGKEHITSIACEPWHFRYIGWPHSQIMCQQNWVLEEYIENLKLYTSFQNAYRFEAAGQQMRIFTLDVSQNRPAVLHLPEGVLWQVSGNNAGGVVVTVWN